MQLSSLVDEAIVSAKIFEIGDQELKSTDIKKDFIKIYSYINKKYNENDILGINQTKGKGFLLTILACIKNGITFIPFDINWPDERKLQIQKISNCKILTNDTLVEAMQTVVTNNFINIKKNEILYILFTSGTTGSPKGAMIKRESYLNYVLWMKAFYSEINTKDRLLLTTNFTFDMSMGDVGFYLVKHVALYISSFKNNIFQLMYELEKYQITIHRTVPYTYIMLTNSNKLSQVNLSQLKTLIFAGSRFPYSLYKELQIYFKNTIVYNLYGPTETTIDVLAYRLTFDESKDISNENVSVGNPIDNNDLLIVDNELYIAGIQVMKGYLSDKVKTKESMTLIDNKDYYKTGDLVFQDSKGKYYISGRNDDTVKITGFRVNLLDIDAYISSLDYIHDAASIAIDTNHFEKKIISYVILKSFRSSQEILNDLKLKLLNYQVPSKIIVLETFPTNSNGKVDKKLLLASLK